MGAGLPESFAPFPEEVILLYNVVRSTAAGASISAVM
jgi:hypothetical protein